MQARFLTEFSREEDVTPLALNYDFGLLTLTGPAPNGTAYMNIQPGSGSAVSYDLVTAGYPADKPAQTMWQVTSTWLILSCWLLASSWSWLCFAIAGCV